MSEHVASGPGLEELYMLLHIVLIGAIVYFGAWKGIVASIRDRSETFAKKIEESKKLLERIKGETAAARKELSEIERIRQRLINEARDNGKAISEQIVKEARHLADKIISDASAAALNEAAQAAGRLQEKLVQQAMAASLAQLDAAKAHGIHEKYVTDFAQGNMTNGKK